MARPREFDEDDVLNKAMICFWEQGYEGASIADLERATGIKRISLYNAFKDKQGLFIATQNKYQNRAKAFMCETFSGNKLQALIDFFNMIGATKTEDTTVYRGCMMVNTALDAYSIGEEVLENVKIFRAMMAKYFEDYLVRCQNSEELRDDLDPKACASFLLGNMWGAATATRLYQNTEQTKLHTNIVVQTIENWRSDN